MKIKITITTILLLVSILTIGCSSSDPINNQSKGNLKAVTCLPEQRNIQACITIYKPVCALKKVECITTPCNPVKETYSSSCMACSNERVISYIEGACK